MHKYNKIRGIVRAKKGSQIPKLVGGGGMNPDVIGDYTAISLADSSDTFTNFSDVVSTSLTGHFGIGAGTSTNTEVLKSGKLQNLGKNIKGNLTKIGKDIKTGLIKDIGNNGINYLNLGIDFIGSKFNDVENSKGVDTVFGLGKTAAGLVGKFNPVAGLAVNGIMTALLGINSLTGKRARTFGADTQAIEQIGSSYGDSVADINSAASLSGKKYGGFSNKKRRAANRAMNEAERLQNIMADIASEASDMRAMAGNDLNYLNYEYAINGGYDQRYMRAAKSGMKLLDKINLVKSRKFNQVINVDTRLVEEFKEGGKLTNTDWKPEIELFEDWKPIIELEIFQKGGKTRTLEELIEYAKKKNPRFIQRLSEDPRGISFVDEEGKNAQGSHLLGYELDEEGNAIVFPSIQEMEDGNLKYLSLWDAFDRAIEKKNFLKMTPEEAKLFTESGEDEKGNLFGYKKGWPEFFLKFKKGGKAREELETPEIEETNQKNLIPEGALHKNKHHMEHTEGLTLKGIPVIDNDGEQLAEIELDEIIFTLEVTKKLEELYKDGSDEAAIEAGKLLVKEILFNTDDRTGLISKCEEGGKICQTEE